MSHKTGNISREFHELKAHGTLITTARTVKYRSFKNMFNYSCGIRLLSLPSNTLKWHVRSSSGSSHKGLKYLPILCAKLAQRVIPFNGCHYVCKVKYVNVYRVESARLNSNGMQIPTWTIFDSARKCSYNLHSSAGNTGLIIIIISGFPCSDSVCTYSFRKYIVGYRFFLFLQKDNYSSVNKLNDWMSFENATTIFNLSF